MVCIKKIGQEYYVEYYVQGLMFRKKGGLDILHAEKLCAEIKASIPQNIEEIYQVRDDSMKCFFEQFLCYAEQEQPSKSFRRYQKCVKHFCQFLTTHHASMTKMSDITPAVIEDYRQALIKEAEQKNKKTHMINWTLFLIRDVFEYAIKVGSVNHNPGLHVQFLDDPLQQLPVYVSTDQMQDLVTGKPQCMVAIIRFIVATGISKRELLRLQWSDIDWDEMMLNVRQERGDGFRQIPLAADSAEALKVLTKVQANDDVFIFSENDLADWAG